MNFFSRFKKENDSISDESEKEGFVDRHELWPFYRRRRYSDETMSEIEDTDRMIREGYNPRRDGTRVQKSRNEKTNPSLKYELVEKPKYLKGRQRMAERGFDLDELDYVIDTLLRGYRLPSNYRNHKLKGDLKGYMECHIGYDWLLVYRYDHRELVLYAVDTGNHKDVLGI